MAIRLWPKTGCKTCSPNNLIGNHSLGEEDDGFFSYQRGQLVGNETVPEAFPFGVKT